MTIEHILSESTNKQEVGYVGNLLPLGESINSNLGNADICQKMESYKKSSFSSVKKFLKDYEGIREWTKDDIIRRTKYMARCMYEQKILPFELEEKDCTN